MKSVATALIVFSLAACSGEPRPGEAAFTEANAHLTDNKNQFVFGNGPVAEQLANSFNVRMKLMLKLGFKARGPTGSTVDDGIITHVNVTDDTVIFLVHVPGLRGFNEDAQGTLLDVAWTLARGRLERLEPARDRKLAVGLRGIILYGAAAFGPASAEVPDTKTNKGVIVTEDFYTFFTGAYPSVIELAPEGTEKADAPEAAAPATARPGGTVTEAPAQGDRVVKYIALLGTDPPSTAIAVAPDLFVASAPMRSGSLSLRLGRLPAIEVTQVGDLPGGDLVLLRPVRAFKVEPIAVAPNVSMGTPATTYFATLEDGVVGAQKFGLTMMSLDDNIHTDERLAVIPQGGALVDAQGRLIGVATSSANVYAPAVQVLRLIAAFRAANK